MRNGRKKRDKNTETQTAQKFLASLHMRNISQRIMRWKIAWCMQKERKKNSLFLIFANNTCLCGKDWQQRHFSWPLLFIFFISQTIYYKINSFLYNNINEKRIVQKKFRTKLKFIWKERSFDNTQPLVSSLFTNHAFHTGIHMACVLFLYFFCCFVYSTFPAFKSSSCFNQVFFPSNGSNRNDRKKK